MKTEGKAQMEDADTKDTFSGAEVAVLLGMVVVACAAASHVVKDFLP